MRWLFLAALLGGCGFSEKEGRGWTERVLYETPRIAQLAFQLKEPPVSTYNQDAQYPNWIGAITYDTFEWRKESKTAYRAVTTATLEPGPRLRNATPPVTRAAKIEITVAFLVHDTPPPLVFLPAGHSLVPTRWRLTGIEGRVVEEGGSAADYREGN